MKKGQILHNVVITTVGFGWVWVGIAEDGRKILVKGSVLPHSTIDCSIFKVKKDYILAMPLRVVSVEPERADQTPHCPHYSNPLVSVPEDYVHKNGCGGCKWQLLSYPKQLELKTHLVEDSFRWVSYLLDLAPLQDIIPSPLTYQYRNKIEFSFGKYITKASNDRKAKWLSNTETVIARKDDEAIHTSSTNSDFSNYYDRQLGFHKQGSYNHVIDVDQCYLISNKLHEVYNHLKQLCKESGLPVYDQKRHSWVLRHIVLRQGFNTDQILVNLVIAHEKINSKELDTLWADFEKKLLSDTILRSHCNTFMITYNDTVSDAIRRAEAQTRILRWDGYIFEELKLKQAENPVRFRISPFSFFQTNTFGAQELFSKAASFIQLPEGKTTIMDLYCGAGTIGLSLLSQWVGTDVIGIEIVEDAIRDAKYNAQLNGLSDKSYFVAGKTEALIATDPVIKEKIEQVWLVMLDPPREGLHKDVCVFLNDLKTKYNFQLIYISCNPVTLARDLDLLIEGWRKLETLQPVDMFPHTHHVEMISVLS